MDEIDGVLKGAKKAYYPQYKSYIIWGFVYGDRKGRFSDGTWIHTSLIKEEWPDNIFKTMNSVYKVEDWIGETSEGNL